MILIKGFMHSSNSASIKMQLVPGEPEKIVLFKEKDNPRIKKILSRVLWKLFRNSRLLGFVPLSPLAKLTFPGAANHYGGTFPMTADSAPFTSDTLGRPWGYHRVHMVDASILPSITAQSPTLTIMANAYRIGSETLTRNLQMTRKIVLTGANGFAGSKIAAYFRQHGDQVIEMGRHPSAAVKSKEDFIPFQLGDTPNTNCFAGVDIFVHCAYDFSLRKKIENERINAQGSIQLFKSAHEAGVPRSIFISSAAAFSGAKSQYGQIKLAIEQNIMQKDVFVVRPALIFGKQAGGMVGALNQMVSKLSFLPMIGNGKEALYLCHYQDFVKCVYQLTHCDNKINKPVFAAHERPLTLKQILVQLGKQYDKHLFFIPVPSNLLYVALKSLEKFGIKSRLRSDSLLGLLHRNPQVDFSETRKNRNRISENSTIKPRMKSNIRN